VKTVSLFPFTQTLILVLCSQSVASSTGLRYVQPAGLPVTVAHSFAWKPHRNLGLPPPVFLPQAPGSLSVEKIPASGSRKQNNTEAIGARPRISTRGGHGSEAPESNLAGFYVFFFGSEVENFSHFSFTAVEVCGLFVNCHCRISVAWLIAGIGTGVLNLKNFQTQIRIRKF